MFNFEDKMTFAKLLNFGCKNSQEDIGYSPESLLNLVREHPEIRSQFQPTPASSIAEGRIIKWNHWAEYNGFYSSNRPMPLLGWGSDWYLYKSSFFDGLGLSALTTRSEISEWECDIQEITGIACSKSKLNEIESLSDLAEIAYEMIDDITLEKLNQNLAHQEIRIIHDKNTTDYLVRYLWDDRINLINSGGSHHFAAARYIAAKLKRKVPIKGKLVVYGLNPSAVTSLCSDFNIYAVGESALRLHGLHAAMRAFQATYYWKPLPSPYKNILAIFLPKNEKRAQSAAMSLHAAGYVDIGKLLLHHIETQASPCC
jgi:hypothetical protein